MEKGNSQRSLSYSEIATAQSCTARWDFRYGGRLAGSALEPRLPSSLLSDGRAWGAAVAAWHAADEPLDLFVDASAARNRWAAQEALIASYEADGIANLGRFAEHQERVGAILDHYMATTTKFPKLTRLEGEFDVAIPSRTGRRASSRYHFTGFLDGVLTLDDSEWLVEFKLRKRLVPLYLIQLSRQILWYAWARQRETGRKVVGVILDQRLNEAPKPARVVKGRRKDTFAPSHAVEQMTTPESYRALCQEFDEEPHEDTLAALTAREWQNRTTITFRPGELEEAGMELVSAAKDIRGLDSGDRYPTRNATPMNCNFCDFRPICANPQDALFVDTLFERVAPKRLRDQPVEPTERAGDPSLPVVGPLAANPFALNPVFIS